MTKEELGQLYPIAVRPYNPEWKDYYKKEIQYLNNLFESELLAEHIGSTAIEGLSAKPTIDIAIEKPNSISDSIIVEILSRNGYTHMVEVTDHLTFVKGYSPTGLEDISYHIHMIDINSDWCKDRVYFRNYLNQNIEYRNEYQKLKEQLAEQFRNDREAYTAAKASFVIKVTEEAKKVLQ